VDNQDEDWQLLQEDGQLDQKPSVSQGASCKYTCWAVPHHLRQRPWPTLLGSPDLTDQLVLTDSPTVTVLSKFEDPQFIHTYISSTGQLKFELPRYQLSFALQDGRLVSLNHSGYHLASNQQLTSTEHYTMPNFRQYLLLEKSETLQRRVTVNLGQQQSHICVLVPAGDVNVETSVSPDCCGLVQVTVSG
jgi:hypothetical protein